MTQTDDERRERERAYNRARYQRIKETDPEKWAAQAAKKAEDRRRRMADPEYAAKHRAAVAAKGRAERRAARGLSPDAALAPTPEERRESIRLKSRIYRRRKAGLPDDPHIPMPNTPRPKLTPEERQARDRERWRRKWEAKKKARLEQERAKRAAEVESAKAAAQKPAPPPPTLRQREISAAYAAGHRAPAPRKMSRFEALRKWNFL